MRERPSPPLPGDLAAYDTPDSARWRTLASSKPQGGGLHSPQQTCKTGLNSTLFQASHRQIADLIKHASFTSSVEALSLLREYALCEWDGPLPNSQRVFVLLLRRGRLDVFDVLQLVPRP